MESLREKIKYELETDISEEVHKVESKYSELVGKGEEYDIDTFRYGTTLVRSNKPSHIDKGVRVLKELIATKKLEKQLACSSLYYIAHGLYKLEKYKECLVEVNRLIELEESFPNAKPLKELCLLSVPKEGVFKKLFGKKKKIESVQLNIMTEEEAREHAEKETQRRKKLAALFATQGPELDEAEVEEQTKREELYRSRRMRTLRLQKQGLGGLSLGSSSIVSHAQESMAPKNEAQTSIPERPNRPAPPTLIDKIQDSEGTKSSRPSRPVPSTLIEKIQQDEEIDKKEKHKKKDPSAKKDKTKKKKRRSKKVEGEEPSKDKVDEIVESEIRDEIENKEITNIETVQPETKENAEDKDLVNSSDVNSTLSHDEIDNKQSTQNDSIQSKEESTTETPDLEAPKKDLNVSRPPAKKLPPVPLKKSLGKSPVPPKVSQRISSLESSKEQDVETPAPKKMPGKLNIQNFLPKEPMTPTQPTKKVIEISKSDGMAETKNQLASLFAKGPPPMSLPGYQPKLEGSTMDEDEFIGAVDKDEREVQVDETGLPVATADHVLVSAVRAKGPKRRPPRRR